MKKIIILLFFILILTGCYDYKELNNLAIISGMSIDYIDDNYKLNLEILNDDENAKNKVYYISGSGKNLTEAFNNVSLKINKIPLYSHIKVVVISQEIAKNKLNDFINYILRNPYITNQFYIVLSSYDNAYSILQNSDENADSIYNLIDNKILGNNIALKINFLEFSSMILNDKQDLYLPTITIENEMLTSSGIAIFKNDKLKNILDYNESQTLEILLDKNKNAYYNFECKKNKFITIDVFEQKVKVNNNIIRLDLTAKIIENQCRINNNIIKKFNEIIKNDVTKIINTLQNNNSDILGINNKYYKKYNKTLDFRKQKIRIKVNTKIENTNLIMEDENDN